jgi:Mn2+/Fe2+ NRAMP family transporter
VACGDAIRDAAADGLGASAAQIVSTIFLVGVWGAIFTSTLGVWNGVPYLFSDYLDALRGRYESDVETRGVAYRGYLLYLAFPPMLLLFLDRPMWVIKVYTLTGGLFMPVLAATLLWLNSRRTLVGSMRNGWAATATLVLALVLFALIAVRQVADFL